MKNERRGEIRVQLEVPVTYYGDDEPVTWQARDVGSGGTGMFVTAANLLRRGTEVEIGFFVPGYEPRIVASARVVWTNDPTRSSYDPRKPPGMGLSLADLEPEYRRAISTFAERTDTGQQDAPGIAASPPPPPPDTEVSLIDDLIADSLDDLDGGESSTAKSPIRGGLSGLDIVANKANPEGAAPPPTPAPAEERLAKDSILGAYIVRRWLGSGGMGDVYEAEHAQLGRRVAIKRLHSMYAENARALQRFFDEARAVNRIQHDHIVQITDFVTEGEHVYFVMEFLEGQTLAAIQESGEILDLERGLDIVAQACEALDAVHKAGIVHRDLKPQNMMLIEHHGRDDFVKLLDFGVAKLVSADGNLSGESTGRTILGTPGYMAPEQLLGNPVDHRADIYAIGVILYQIATGTNPFVADTWGQAVVKHATAIPPRPSELANTQHALPPELESLILRCLEKDPEDRPNSALEIALMLRGVSSTHRSGTVIRNTAPRRWPLWVGAALVLVLAGSGVGGFMFRSQLMPYIDQLTGAAADETPVTVVETPPAKTTTVKAATTSSATSEGAKADAASDSTPADTAAPDPDQTAADSDQPKTAEAMEKPDRAPPSSPRSRSKRRNKRAATPTARDTAPSPAPSTTKRVSATTVTSSKSTTAPTPTVAAAANASAADVLPADQHYKDGKTHLRNNKALLAVEELNLCLAIDPRHYKAYRMMGKAYVMLGRESKAIAAFEKFVALAPNHKDADKIRQIIAEFKKR